jgi:hypothetical protein
VYYCSQSDDGNKVEIGNSLYREHPDAGKGHGCNFEISFPELPEERYS